MDDDTDATSSLGQDIENGHVHSSLQLTSSSASLPQPSNAMENEPTQTFDTSMVSQHTYLGDLSDVPRTHDWAPSLIPGHVYDLPLLPLQSVVMVPGAIVPLHMSLHARVLRLALQAPAPSRNLLAVVCSLPLGVAGLYRCQRVGCIVELQQQSEAHPAAEGAGDDDENTACYLAKGLCRFSLDRASIGPDRLARCIVLTQEALPMMPREAADGQAHLPRWVCSMYDCNSLAQQARQQVLLVAPKVHPPTGDACQLSYWLLRNMPLECKVRQELLEMDSVTLRLRREIGLLEHMAQQLAHVYCGLCRAQVGRMCDALSMTDCGAGGIFVNPHGYVHDMLALRHATSVELDGEPETRDSWFPGYAWTIANCHDCGGHLGWRFTAVEPQLVPLEFFGIRRDRIAPTAAFERRDPMAPPDVL